MGSFRGFMRTMFLLSLTAGMGIFHGVRAAGFSAPGARAARDQLAHVTGEIFFAAGFAHDRFSPAEGSAEVYISVTTDDQVTAVTVVKPGGEPVELHADDADSRGEIEWEYEEENQQDLSGWPDGNYVFKFRYADRSEEQTSAPFSRADGSPLAVPEQRPRINGAVDDYLLLLHPGDSISWRPCQDGNANLVHFELDCEFDDILPEDESEMEVYRTLDEDAAAGHEYTPHSGFPPGVFDAWLHFADSRRGVTEEGVPYTVAKFRGVGYTMVVETPDNPVANIVDSLVVAFSWDADESRFHMNVTTSPSVDSVGVINPAGEPLGYIWSYPSGDRTVWACETTWSQGVGEAPDDVWGVYGIVVDWNDGRATHRGMTHFFFTAAEGRLTPFPVPRAVPVLVEPADGATVSSPVAFGWSPWPTDDPGYDPEYGRVRLQVGYEGADHIYHLCLYYFSADSTGTGQGISIPAGSCTASLKYLRCRGAASLLSTLVENRRDDSGVNGDGIPVGINAWGPIGEESRALFTVEQAAPPGSLTVVFTPEAAGDLGAKWSVDGFSWHTSGETVDLAPGEYNITFNAPHWNLIPPAPRAVTIASQENRVENVQWALHVRDIDIVQTVVGGGEHRVSITADASSAVTAVSVHTPAGRTLALDQENDGDGRDDEDREWSFRALGLSDFSDYGQGDYTFIFTFAGREQHQSVVRFGHVTNGESALELPSQIPELETPAPTGARVRTDGPEVVLTWTPCTDDRAVAVHVELASVMSNWFDPEVQDWRPYRQERDFDIAGGVRQGDPGVAAFEQVPGGVYTAGLYFADGDGYSNADLVDCLVALASGREYSVLVRDPDSPVEPLLESVALDRTVTYSPAGRASIRFSFVAALAEALPDSTVQTMILRTPQGEELPLLPDPNAPGCWGLRVGGRTGVTPERFPPGFYDLQVTCTDSRATACGTIGFEFTEDDLSDAATPVQVPAVHLPSEVRPLPLPLEISWDPCLDSAVQAVRLLLENAAMDEQQAFDYAADAVAANLQDGDVLPGIFTAAVRFERRRAWSPAARSPLQFRWTTATERCVFLSIAGETDLSTVQIGLEPGWNLLSLPVVPYPDPAPQAVFGDSVLGDVWQWNADLQCYEPVSAILPGRAFWVYRAGAATSLNVDGIAAFDEMLPLDPGWNLLGLRLAPGNETSPPEDVPVYEWSGMQYVVPDVLRSLAGYWFYSASPVRTWTPVVADR